MPKVDQVNECITFAALQYLAKARVDRELLKPGSSADVELTVEAKIRQDGQRLQKHEANFKGQLCVGHLTKAASSSSVPLDVLLALALEYMGEVQAKSFQDQVNSYHQEASSLPQPAEVALKSIATWVKRFRQTSVVEKNGAITFPIHS